MKGKSENAPSTSKLPFMIALYEQAAVRVWVAMRVFSFLHFARFFLKRVFQKPAVADICADFIHCSPQGRQTVQMLDRYRFEQHYWVYAWASVILGESPSHKCG